MITTSLNEKNIVHSDYLKKTGEYVAYLEKPFILRLYREIGIPIFIIPWVIFTIIFLIGDLTEITIKIALLRIVVVTGLMLFIQPFIILLSKLFDKKKTIHQYIMKDITHTPICAYYDQKHGFTYFTEYSFYFEKPRTYLKYVVDIRVHVSNITYKKEKREMIVLWNYNTVVHNIKFTFPQEWDETRRDDVYIKIKQAFLGCKSELLKVINKTNKRKD